MSLCSRCPAWLLAFAGVLVLAVLAGFAIGTARGDPEHLKPDVVRLAPPAAAHPDNRDDALAEVNAMRATRRMRPYERDEGLTLAARAAAKYRADRLMFGHAMDHPLGDFRFLPGGASAATAGCAAYPASYGWLSCDIWEPNRYAGAAWWPGRDGKRYMHIFVR